MVSSNIIAMGSSGAHHIVISLLEIIILSVSITFEEKQGLYMSKHEFIELCFEI